MSTTSDVLTDEVRSATAVTKELRQGSGGPGEPVPQPQPPAPNVGNVDARVLRDQLAALKRQQRDTRKQTWSTRIKGVNRQYWTYAGLGAALIVGVLGCRSYQADQRDTALALASIAGGGDNVAAVEQTPQTVTVNGIDNPLEQLKLTGQARWAIGIDDDGSLFPTRSAIVIAQLLERVDLCSTYIGINDKATPILSDTPAAGSQPLVECDREPALATTTTAPVTTLPPATTTGQ